MLTKKGKVFVSLNNSHKRAIVQNAKRDTNDVNKHSRRLHLTCTFLPCRGIKTLVSLSQRTACIYINCWNICEYLRGSPSKVPTSRLFSYQKQMHLSGALTTKSHECQKIVMILSFSESLSKVLTLCFNENVCLIITRREKVIQVCLIFKNKREQ